MEVTDILVDRYQIQELLSHKAGRKTFLARDLQSQSLAIVKILSFNLDFQWDDLKLFEREAATLQNLDRPEIPKYLDYFEVDTADTRGFALVQSYLDAPSLQTLIQQGRKFSEAEIRELAMRLLDILTYLHQQNPPVIHRDIKPSNILLSNRSGNSIGDVYLVDFGAVQTVASKEEGTITIVGTYGYIPLEQFGGKTTPASDLYSLGMTLIYLLTGTHPSELPQVEGRVKFTSEIDRQFDRWLVKMTQPHLDLRFDSAQTAKVALASEDVSYGDFVHLKPKHTEIELCRDRDKLEIIWCESSISNTYIAIFIIYAICLLAIFITCGVFWAFITTLFIIVFANVAYPFRSSSLHSEKYHLVIDDLHIYKLKERGRKHQFIELSKHTRFEAEMLAYNPGYTFDKCVDTNGKLIRGGTITIPSKLYLYCGNREYFFADRFSAAELWWLGKELSDFLNLELQVIYHAPQVPEAPSCGGGC